MQDILTVKNLVAYYGKLQILQDISFSVKKQSITAFIGPNGAGKSTLLNSIIGLVESKTGKITFRGKDITNFRINKIVQEGISLVPEDKLIFPRMTVEENLLLGAYNNRAWGNSKNKLLEIYKLLPRLEERKKMLARTLSGGEQQMLTMGRGLMAEPELLMLDEPFLGIAPKLVMELYETILKIRNEGVTILLNEQNVAQSIELSDYTYVLESGNIVMEGSKELADNPHIKTAYLRI